MRGLVLISVLTAAVVTPGFGAAAAGISTSPTAIQFSYQIGAATLPVAQVLQVTSSPSALNFTAAISGSPFNAAWLLISSTTGVTPDPLKVEVNPTSLAAGAYAGTITFTAVSGTQTYTQSVIVTLLVSNPPATVTASPTTLNFTYVTGAPVPNPSLSSAFILASSGSAVSATVSVTGASWLTVTPAGNISLVGLFHPIAVKVNPTGLAPKVYSANVTISAPAATNKTTTVAVTLTVAAAPPIVTGLWPPGVIQGASPPIVTVEGNSYYSTSTVSASGFSPAATVTATDGTNTATETFVIPAYQPTSTEIYIDVASPMPSGVAAAAYTQPLATIGGTAPYTYSLIGGVMPAGLSISGTNISGTPTAAGSYTFVVEAMDSSATPLIAYSYLKLTIAPAASAALAITIAAAPLPLGTVGTVYGPVTLTATGGTGGPYTWSALNLPPGMTLSAAGVLTGTPSTDGSLGPLAGSVVSNQAILATVPTADLANAGVLRLAVTTPAPGGGTSNEGQFQIYGPGPQITAITNSASFQQGTLAPGEVLTIFGLGLGPAALALFDPSMPPIPTVLPSASPSTSVTINGTAAPIIYTSASQVGVIVPYSIAGASAQVVVTYGGIASQAFTVAVATVDPGIYSLASSGQGQGAILNFVSGSYTINSTSNPAPRGSTVVIYLTGAGATTSVVDNQLIPSNPAITPALSPLVTIGGQAATVLAAQAPVGSVPGLIQLNVTVPTGLTAGAALPVIATIGGVQSQAGLTIAVK
jgi:trimeric autotransporter adhesin